MPQNLFCNHKLPNLLIAIIICWGRDSLAVCLTSKKAEPNVGHFWITFKSLTNW